jgi:ATP-binding cassette subfamily F protein uup
MIAQRGESLTPKSAQKPRRRALEQSGAGSAATTKRKLSFKDKHALHELPPQIAQLESEIARLQSELSDASLFLREPARFTAMTARLADAHTSLMEREDRWIELEMLRSEIEGAA